MNTDTETYADNILILCIKKLNTIKKPVRLIMSSESFDTLFRDSTENLNQVDRIRQIRTKIAGTDRWEPIIISK